MAKANEDQIRIASWIIAVGTIAGLILGIISYVMPPDPANPMKLDFLLKSLSIPPWVAISAILFTIIATATVTWRVKPEPELPPQQLPSPSPEIEPVKLDAHPTALDPRPNAPQKDIYYIAKLRLSFENKTGEVVRVLPPSWITGQHNISVQCGNPPYPGVPYAAGMMEFCHFYQLEEYVGSWKQDKWKMKPNGEHDEHKEINVEPGWTFRIWIGLNPCVPHNILEARRKTNQLGILILPLIIAGKPCEWRGQI